MDLREDQLEGPEIAELVREHLESMNLHSPPESMHAMGLDSLRGPGMTVWTAWEGAALLGCGALKELDARHAEIKSMRTARAHLRKGVASTMLRHLLEVARARGYRRLSLETGSQQVFQPAIALYERFGFERCGPFGSYSLDPNSVFMTLRLKVGEA